MVDSTASKPGLNGPGKTVAQMLGEIVWLMSQSALHKHMSISDLEWYCMPPLLLERYRLFYGPQSPAAVALWATVSAETEQRLVEGATRLRADEWNGGNERWLIDLVAPFGGQEEILRDLGRTVFGGQPFKFNYIDQSGRRVVATFDPAASSDD